MEKQVTAKSWSDVHFLYPKLGPNENALGQNCIDF